jgi:hypothetical protein
MKNQSTQFNAKNLVRSVEKIRDHVTGKRKQMLRTTHLKAVKSHRHLRAV